LTTCFVGGIICHQFHYFILDISRGLMHGTIFRRVIEKTNTLYLQDWEIPFIQTLKSKIRLRPRSRRDQYVLKTSRRVSKLRRSRTRLDYTPWKYCFSLIT